MSVSKKCAFVVAAGAIALPLVSISPASADSPGCVTHKEFNHVKRGMGKQRVTKIFDTAGKQSSFYTIGGDVYITKDYKPCAKYASISVDYKNGRVQSKFGFWA